MLALEKMLTTGALKWAPPKSLLASDCWSSQARLEGELAEKPGQAYCENRRTMDRFMAVVPNAPDADNFANTSMRESYKQHAKNLGALRDSYCRVDNYYGMDFLGSVTYTGPGE